MSDVTVPEDALWDLVDKWREQAMISAGRRETLRYLSVVPLVAHAQGLNSAAEDLADLILAIDDAQAGAE